MFRQLASLLIKSNRPASSILDAGPNALMAYLELRLNPKQELRNDWLAALEDLDFSVFRQEPGWHHLIYAYMIENTKIVEIFKRVLFEYLHGEKLGTPSEEAQKWLRITEELFYRETSPLFIGSITSEVRPLVRHVRRNAYYRMFGMDLNHGTDDNHPLAYVKPEASNRGFVPTLEGLLRELWIAITNAKNQNGTNPTDKGTILNLIKRLRDMLHDRRQNGNLKREEFFAVAAMSWFHLTVEFNTPIVASLSATASSAAERLRKIGERCKLDAATKAENYFDLAEPLSRFLKDVEADKYTDVNQIELLYKEGIGVTNYAYDDMITIISHWSQATGNDLKATRVTPTK